MNLGALKNKTSLRRGTQLFKFRPAILKFHALTLQH